VTDQIPPGSGLGRGMPAPPPGRDPAGCSPELRKALGSYALGALDPVEADQVRRHLVDCPACRFEYREMAAMPALLSRIPEIEMSVGATPARPGPDMLTRLLDRAAVFEGSVADSAASSAAASSASAPFADSAPQYQAPRQPGAAVAHRRHRTAGSGGMSGLAARLLDRWRQGSPLQHVSIVTAGTALVAAAAVGSYAATSSSPAPAFSNTLSATNSTTGISGIVDYHSVDWGSWVQVTMHGVPAGDDCSLIAVDAKGARAVASTWTAPPGGTATIPGGLAMAASSIVEFEVVTTSGSTLLAIPAH
jgi:hypothetical protein